ncbi:MAG: alpha/beta hydrolase family protein [Chthoniobacteraceae bacterium]
MKNLPLCALAITVLSTAVFAESLPDGRQAPLKDLDGDFSWTPFPSKDAWEKRADDLRMQMRVALGLWPEPTRTPLNAVIHGKIERDDYTVENVYFESMPGFFVTGSLFRPKNVSGKVPAVLCPHGHWQDARVALKGDAEVKAEIESGQERFANGGRSAFQSIGVQLARMGCVAFVIDMLGNSDSQQISLEIAHGFKKQRPEMISPEPGKWGLYSPQAESNLQSVMGLQTWNCIRALDFLTSLPEVDPSRLACTGASGGGTQTMILAALDPRLAVAFPCVMVSTAMQGGCTCENACLLRVGTGNIEFAALFAPKPMGMTTAKDWTIDLPTKGFPALKEHWAMMGAPENVRLFAHPEFPHNYNIVTREHIYGFFNEHLKLGLPEGRLKEQDYEPLTREQLTVWDDKHPAPAGGPELEKGLLQWWFDDARQQLRTTFAAFEEVARPAVQALLSPATDSGKVSLEVQNGAREGEVKTWIARRTPENIQVSGLCVGKGKPVLVLLPGGSRSILDGDAPNSFCASLVAQGFEVWSADLWNQPSHPNNTMDGGKTPRVANPREAAAYTFGYNLSDVAEQVRDVRMIMRALSARNDGSKLSVIALGAEVAPIAAAAAALDPGRLTALAVDTGGFRFQNIMNIRDPNFQPGGAKYGDLPGLLALGAPQKLFLIGEGPTGPDLVTAAYETAGKSDTLRVASKANVEQIAQWMSGAAK